VLREKEEIRWQSLRSTAMGAVAASDMPRSSRAPSAGLPAVPHGCGDAGGRHVRAHGDRGCLRLTRRLPTRLFQRHLQRKIDLHNASASHVDHDPAFPLDKLQAIADAAWQDRKVWMANAWRSRPRSLPSCSAPSPRSAAICMTSHCWSCWRQGRGTETRGW
jgi:hypothetical protein